MSNPRGPYRWSWQPAWLVLLRALHASGHPDSHIAAELSLAFDPESFTRDQVRHQRFTLGLSANRPRSDPPLSEIRRWSWRKLQTREGWGHLLPTYVPAAGARSEHGRKGYWSPGHELRPAETRLLSLLRDRGPLNRRGLLNGLRLAVLPMHRGRCLGRLLSLGLVYRSAGHAPLYALAGDAALSPRLSLG